MEYYKFKTLFEGNEYLIDQILNIFELGIKYDDFLTLNNDDLRIFFQ